MKIVLKLEALGLLVLFTSAYFHFFPGTWGFYLSFFFVPDISFALYLVSKKVGGIAYNFFHHQGVLAILLIFSFLMKQPLLEKISIVFLAHSTFDRIAGYGLKYMDSFDHTHLGWIGKSKHLNNPH